MKLYEANECSISLSQHAFVVLDLGRIWGQTSECSHGNRLDPKLARFFATRVGASDWTVNSARGNVFKNLQRLFVVVTDSDGEFI